MISGEVRVNRTGLAAAPFAAQTSATTAPTRSTSEVPAADAVPWLETPGTFEQVRAAYADISLDVGTVPPPGSAQGADKLARRDGVVLFDMLGERLAFERTAVRLYEAAIAKHDIYGSWDEGPTRDDLERARDEELEHALVLHDVLAGLGGDPSAVSPGADVQAVLHRGLWLVLVDPRTTLRHAVEALLVLELVDAERWEALEDLVLAVGEEHLVPEVAGALEAEREHLRAVRHWHGAGLSAAATGGFAGPFAERAARRSRAAAVASGGQIHTELEGGAPCSRMW